MLPNTTASSPVRRPNAARPRRPSARGTRLLTTICTIHDAAPASHRPEIRYATSAGYPSGWVTSQGISGSLEPASLRASVDVDLHVRLDERLRAMDVQRVLHAQHDPHDVDEENEKGGVPHDGAHAGEANPFCNTGAAARPRRNPRSCRRPGRTNRDNDVRRRIGGGLCPPETYVPSRIRVRLMSGEGPREGRSPFRATSSAS